MSGYHIAAVGYYELDWRVGQSQLTLIDWAARTIPECGIFLNNFERKTT